MNYLILLQCLVSVALASIKGITYSPYSQTGCFEIDKVNADIVTLSRFTKKVRLYGGDCNQVSNVLAAITKNRLDMKVTLGIWTRKGLERQQTDTQEVFKAYANKQFRNHIVGVVVGNEERFNGIPEDKIINDIISVRDQLRSKGINITVSYSEALHLWTPALAQHSDIIMPTIYPFYLPNNGQPLDLFARDTVNKIIKDARAIHPNKPILVGETGYPNGGDSNPKFAGADQHHQCIYLTQFDCQSRRRNLNYFFLEAWDAPWKSGASSEQHFGLLRNNDLGCPELMNTRC